MGKRLRVAVVYGGRSGEHEVSLRSAASVIAALDPERYEVVPIAISKAGRWLTGPESLRLLEAAQRELAPVVEHGVEVTIPAEPTRRALVPLAPAPGAGARAPALAEAASYDPKVVVEEAIDGREFECAVLGNEAPEASVVGELVPSREFYDYADKYVEQGARVIIPAAIPNEVSDHM